MIERMLVLSTEHITPETAQHLEYHQPACWSKGDFGWFLYVPEDTSELPTDLEACIHLARNHGVFWIMFDRDAPAVVNLPTFDW